METLNFILNALIAYFAILGFAVTVIMGYFTFKLNRDFSALIKNNKE